MSDDRCRTLARGCAAQLDLLAVELRDLADSDGCDLAGVVAVFDVAAASARVALEQVRVMQQPVHVSPVVDDGGRG